MVVKFDKNNTNCLLFLDENKKLISAIAIPPDNGIDIIDINNELLEKGYTHNFKGIIVFKIASTNSLYVNGKHVETVKRNSANRE